jgi:hypothetical protein
MHRAIVALGLAGTAAAFAPSAGLPSSVRRAAGVCLACILNSRSRRRGETSSRNRAGEAVLRWSEMSWAGWAALGGEGCQQARQEDSTRRASGRPGMSGEVTAALVPLQRTHCSSVEHSCWRRLARAWRREPVLQRRPSFQNNPLGMLGA